jgi:hypothetical protein
MLLLVSKNTCKYIIENDKYIFGIKRAILHP